MQARRSLGLPQGDLIIGTVGHLRAEKNQERLAASLRQAELTRPARLLLVGGGPFREHLGRLARELGVADRVHFPGIIQQPVDWYRAMNVFALSSDTEQMPIALLEAMAVGLPGGGHRRRRCGVHGLPEQSALRHTRWETRKPSLGRFKCSPATRVYRQKSAPPTASIAFGNSACRA